MGDGEGAADLIDAPDVLEAVEAAFEAYDRALLAGDVAALEHWFWSAPTAIRFGLGEELYGAEAIAGYRRTAPTVVRGPFTRTTITTFGTDVATVCAEFHEPDGVGRQTQTWLRTREGWRIASAHVSIRASTS